MISGQLSRQTGTVLRMPPDVSERQKGAFLICQETGTDLHAPAGAGAQSKRLEREYRARLRRSLRARLRASTVSV
jgi:hypothetical protein